MEELRRILASLRGYCEVEQLPHTIINEAELSPSVIDRLRENLQ
jgi:hypothetical protein